MGRKLSIRDLDLGGETVFIRVDFNVPLAAGVVSDDTRIRASLPTIERALAAGARVVLASHLGRPDGKRKEALSLAPVGRKLAELLGRPVAFASDCVGAGVRERAAGLAPGEVLLLENLRFHPEEEKNDPAFAGQLAALCTVYVNDAFGTAHRAHASTEGMAHLVPRAAAGLLMEKELTYLGAAQGKARRPYVAILGGAKVSDKLPILRNLATKADAILVGGGMAYTFLKARGVAIGESLLEDGMLADVRAIETEAVRAGARLLLPTDHVVAREVSAEAETQTVIGDVPAGYKGLDIGPESVRRFEAEIAPAGTILWNGPMGVFELPPFAAGTMAVARAVAESGADSIVGGGDSIAAVHMAGVSDRISHVSTGGGASLEFLAGLELPGVSALSEASA